MSLSSITTTAPNQFSNSPGQQQVLKKTIPSLKYGRSKNQFRRLPFMARGEEIKALCWNLPATGGYEGGYRAGEAMAISFLKYLRSQDAPFFHTELTSITQSIMERWSQEGGHRMAAQSMANQSLAYESLHGQCCGFFNTLLPWIQAAASGLGRSLDGFTEDDVLRMANTGLSSCPEREV
jgi:hypothetical protein